MSNADVTNFFIYDPSNILAQFERVQAAPAAAVYEKEMVRCGRSFYNYLPTLREKPNAVGVFSSAYFYDFYFRIWIAPPFLNLVNPTRNTPFNFGIWNAYPDPAQNTLQTFVQTGSPGVATTLQQPDVFQALQFKIYSLEFTAEAPIVVDETIQFSFSLGFGMLQVHAVLAATLAVPPEQPVTEKWLFMSDVMLSYNGTEQRIALRSAPRRELTYDTIIVTPGEYQQQIKSLWSSLAQPIVIPFYQYLTTVTQKTSAGSQVIFLDTSNTDVQVNDYVFVSSVLGQFTARVLGVNANYLSLDSSLPFPLSVGDIACPAFACYLANKTQTQIKGFQVGRVAVTANTPNPPHLAHSRPGSMTYFTIIDGLIVLDKVPLGNKEDDFGVDTGGQMVDFNTGVGRLYTSFICPKFIGSRVWKINRYLAPRDMDYWRDFCQAVNGQQNAFLLPTYRPDIQFDPGAPFVGSSVTMVDTTYSTVFRPSAAMQWIGIKTNLGWSFGRVTGVFPSSFSGGDVVSFSPALPVGSSIILSVCLAIRCRLSSDTITLTHYSLTTEIEMSFMSTDQ